LVLDPEARAKVIRKLHLSKLAEDANATKAEAKDGEEPTSN
jgi:hypothetical protein